MTRAPAFGLALAVAFALPAQGDELPKDAPETMLLMSRCQVCHTLEYVTQQRLTEPQWKKTIEKMVKFGAPLSPQELPGLLAFLAARLPPELPDPPHARVAPPEGALPKKGKRR